MAKTVQGILSGSAEQEKASKKPAANYEYAPVRTPFVFTSTLRMLKAGGESASKDMAKKTRLDRLQSELGKLQSEGAQSNQETRGSIVIQEGPASPIPSSTLGSGVPMTTMPYIRMAVNPNTISWSQNKRITSRDTLGGKVYFHFAGKNGSNNDILIMSFSGNTGNIKEDQGEKDSGTSTTKAALKRQIWHELYNLTREPIFLSEYGNIRNDFIITYSTLLIPSITLIGFFNSVLNFSENAQNPFSRDYSFAFTVTETTPSLDDLARTVI
jgi:hypothetical protein